MISTTWLSKMPERLLRSCKNNYRSRVYDRKREITRKYMRISCFFFFNDKWENKNEKTKFTFRLIITILEKQLRSTILLFDNYEYLNTSKFLIACNSCNYFFIRYSRYRTVYFYAYLYLRKLFRNWHLSDIICVIYFISITYPKEIYKKRMRSRKNGKILHILLQLSVLKKK